MCMTARWIFGLPVSVAVSYVKKTCANEVYCPYLHIIIMIKAMTKKRENMVIFNI